MIEIEDIRKKVFELRQKYVVKKAENEKLESEIERLNQRNSLLFNDIDNGLKAIELIESVASFERSAIKSKIESVVSNALSLIYGDEHRIEIDYSLKRNRTCVDISYLKNTNSGEVKRAMGGFGGGVADTMSLPLKLLILLSSNVSDRILVADEPGKHIDVNRIEKFGEFLHELSSKLGIQLIICTHHEALKDYADNVYAVSITKDTNVSSVSRVKSSRTLQKQGFSCIRRVSMHNFESHKDTSIDFEPGFNAIVGDSDCGKSTIIRAISAVCYNQFDNASIRIGSGECWMEVETDRGVVRLTKGSCNCYDVFDRRDGQKYSMKCVAKTVPSIVQEITGIRPLVIGDITDYPNMMFQMDGHYMLSEVNGEDCNSNMIARIMDGVIGLGGVEELVNEISSDINRNKRQTTSNLNTVVDLKASMNNQDDLDELGRKCDKLEKMLESLDNLVSELGAASSVLEQIMANEKSSSSVETVDGNKVAAADLLLSELSFLVSKCRELSLLNGDFITNFNRIEAIRSSCPSDSEVSRACLLLDETGRMIESLGSYKKMKETIDDSDGKIGMAESSLSVCGKMLAKAEVKLDEYRAKNRICPLCGRPF